MRSTCSPAKAYTRVAPGEDSTSRGYIKLGNDHIECEKVDQIRLSGDVSSLCLEQENFVAAGKERREHHNVNLPTYNLDR